MIKPQRMASGFPSLSRAAAAGLLQTLLALHQKMESSKFRSCHRNSNNYSIPAIFNTVQYHYPG